MTIDRALLALVAMTWISAAWGGERCSALTGDTLRCGRERVKVEGLSVAGGEQARQRLERRLRAGEIVIQRRGQDRHGRTLGRVYVNGNRITQSDIDGPAPRAGARRL